MGIDTMDALQTSVRELIDDTAIRAVVIAGASDVGTSTTSDSRAQRHFSVGMNLKQLSGVIMESVAETSNYNGTKSSTPTAALERLLDQRLAVLDAIERAPKPFVAALVGFCLGGGLELPLACHLRVAAEEPGAMQAGLPELELGTGTFPTCAPE